MSDRRPVRLVDAFAEEPMAGNPAGVVTDAGDLTDDQMAAIAGELGASETAFVRPSESADYRLRYFSPEREVDLCGHATVAALDVLHETGKLAVGEHAVETNVGVLDVEIGEEGTVWLTQSPPEIREVDLSFERLADALGVDVAALSEVGEELPVARASTGFPFLVVPVGYFEQLSAVEPDRGAIEALCEEVDAEGLYAFTFDTLESAATAHGRAFAPLAGIPEDPVTGTGCGAVAAYLRFQGALDAEDPLVFEQGHFLDRPGRVLVRTDGAAPTVGGRAATALEGELSVPDSDEDDIIEA